MALPVYNGAKYLDECLSSILAQDYQNWKCIIHNNCSKDETVTIAEKFIKKDQRFELRNHTEFLPLVPNWNRALASYPEEAKYMKIVCADDWFYEDYLTKMVTLMESHPQVGICSSYRINGLRVDNECLNIYDGPVFDGREILIRQLKKEIFVTGGGNGVLYRKSTLQKLENFPEVHNEKNLHCDTELACDVLNISSFGFVFRILSYNRYHPESVTDRSERLNTFISQNEIILNKFKHVHPDIAKEYKKIRRRYAYYLLKKRIMLDNQSLNWHKENMQRNIKPSEYISGLLMYNFISQFFMSVLKLKNYYKKRWHYYQKK
jgi:glycosyltransferase involved in cell wall biosynthesis